MARPAPPGAGPWSGLGPGLRLRAPVEAVQPRRHVVRQVRCTNTRACASAAARGAEGPLPPSLPAPPPSPTRHPRLPSSATRSVALTAPSRAASTLVPSPTKARTRSRTHARKRTRVLAQTHTHPHASTRAPCSHTHKRSQQPRPPPRWRRARVPTGPVGAAAARQNSERGPAGGAESGRPRASSAKDAASRMRRKDLPPPENTC